MKIDEYDITEAFRKIEDELISSMVRNMKRHRAEEDDMGINWSMWQAEQLKALEKYKKFNQKKYTKQFKSINRMIEDLIRTCHEEGNMDQEKAILRAIKKGFTGKRKITRGMEAEFFKLNERKLDALIKATTDDMEKAETAILRMANDQYRKAIFNAQVYANTGAGTYEKAVDMAMKDFLAAGINCVQYKNGSRHTSSEYANMAIRTASKRAYLQGEGEKRQEWGICTVILNKRTNPCPKCLPFCGKVLIDDVWSGGPSDGISPETGVKYPLMSKAVKEGLYHPNCKDSHTTYFEGISTPPTGEDYSEQDIEEITVFYNDQQKIHVSKRNYERYSRMAENSLDEDNQKHYAAKAEEWKKQYGTYYELSKARQKQAEKDKEQFERYLAVLMEEAPDNLDDFLEIKYNDKAEYGKLKHNYRIVNSYENNSGEMAIAKIIELDQKAFDTKQLFTGKARKKANIAVIEIDGEFKIGNSQINKTADTGFSNFSGDKSQIVFKTDNPYFKTMMVGSHTRDMDSEAKLLEYAAKIADDKEPHLINLLSEKCMCASCLSVLQQFKKRYPNVEINAVSNKKERAERNKNKPWEYR